MGRKVLSSIHKVRLDLFYSSTALDYFVNPERTGESKIITASTYGLINDVSTEDVVKYLAERGLVDLKGDEVGRVIAWTDELKRGGKQLASSVERMRAEMVTSVRLGTRDN